MAIDRVVLFVSAFLFFPAPFAPATHAARAAFPAQTPAAASISSQVRSTLTVTVPNDAAELTIEGQAIPGSGPSRTYETPPLDRGTPHRYTITAKWQPNTYTTMTRSKTVAFRAGEPLTIDLTVHDPSDRVVVQYVPTPPDIADEMVKLAGVTAADVVYEPGCGDARVTIAAVKAGARRAVCIDIDPELVAEARAKVKEAGLADRIEVRLGDALEIADLSAANVVFLYMGDHFNLLIRPILWSQLKPGSRVVSHRFRMGDWEPEKTVWVGSVEGSDYELHRWTVTDEVKRKTSTGGAR
jgi:uncharacterized protein (TIGR03000 family)